MHLDHYLEAARRAALEAGAFIREHIDTGVKVRAKGRNDVVTEVDHRCEEMIRDCLLGVFPDHAFLGEESGLSQDSTAPLWIVDPLDGTKNFVHGYPFVCVSIALEIDGKVRVGVVFDPLREELFTAVEGGGARRNGEPIQVSDARCLEESMLCTGFYKNSPDLMKLFYALQQRAHGVRRDGSAALDLCYVACGRFEGFWELGLNAWDVAAGTLIITEAQGMVTDFTGKPPDIRAGSLVCSNVRIHRALLDEIGNYI